MQGTALPNDWTSNISILLFVPLVTLCTMRIKNNMCSSYPKAKTKYAVDLANMLWTNALAVASVVLWCTVMPNASLATVAVVDALAGVPIERWLIQTYMILDNTTGHPGSRMGRSVIHQRMRLSFVLATVVRGYCAAVTAVLPMAVPPHCTYVETTVVIPLMYTVWRTLLLDVDMYNRISHQEIDTADDRTDATVDGNFTITSDDDTTPL